MLVEVAKAWLTLVLSVFRLVPLGAAFLLGVSARHHLQRSTELKLISHSLARLRRRLGSSIVTPFDTALRAYPISSNAPPIVCEQHTEQPPIGSLCSDPSLNSQPLSFLFGGLDGSRFCIFYNTFLLKVKIPSFRVLFFGKQFLPSSQQFYLTPFSQP